MTDAPGGPRRRRARVAAGLKLGALALAFLARVTSGARKPELRSEADTLSPGQHRPTWRRRAPAVPSQLRDFARAFPGEVLAFRADHGGGHEAR